MPRSVKRPDDTYDDTNYKVFTSLTRDEPLPEDLAGVDPVEFSPDQAAPGYFESEGLLELLIADS